MEREKRPQAIEALCREATKCRACFSAGTLKPSTIDVAQPRRISEGYWASKPRVCVLMLNPAAGTVGNLSANQEMRTLLHSFRSGSASLDDVFKFQRNDFPNWGKPPGRFLKFFATFGLDIDRIALANVAWCATADNSYPSDMRDKCMARFTKRLLAQLKPDLIMLSGSDVHKYEKCVQHLLPGARTFKALHFAHRKGDKAESSDAENFQKTLSRLRF